jgi:hypothetical protein
MNDEDQVALNEGYAGEGEDQDGEGDNDDDVGEEDFRGTLNLARALAFVTAYRDGLNGRKPSTASTFHTMECLQLDITRPPFVDNASETRRLSSWERVGATGQEMESVTSLSISFEGRPDWDGFASMLWHWRRPIKLEVEGDDDYDGPREEVEQFGRAIHEHPSITSFETRDAFSVDCFDIIFAALNSLPALTTVKLWYQEWEEEENPVIPHPEQLTEFLRTPSLRVVEFDFFCFTNALCEAMASALSAGSQITSLRLNSCLFPEGVSSDIASALQENSALRTLEWFDNDVDADFFAALAKSLAVNTTLTTLVVRLSSNDSSVLLTPVFHAMAVNDGIKSLVVDKFKLSDETVSVAIRYGMERNSTLEELVFYDVASVNAESVPWRDALAFLPTNKHLKALAITVGGQRLGQPLVDLYTDAATLLQDNTALQSLDIFSHSIRPVDYFQTMSCLKGNVTLKMLQLSCFFKLEDGDDKCCEEAAELVSAIQKNYGLESLGSDIESQVPLVCAVLRLNSAGRQYLVQDAASTANGCALLSAVSDDLDCLYFHLLENPSLCERRE